MKPRCLVIDLENTPALGYFWGRPYQADIIKIVEPSRVMCFAAKWRGDRKVMFHSTHHDGLEGMVQAAWDLLDEADGVVSWNGKQHDTPHFHTEFQRAGLGFPSPYREIDLCLVARRRLKFQANRLNYVAGELGLGQKVTHQGLPLWLACMEGDDRAWRKFRAYNIQDVRLTDAAYTELLPAVPQSMHPNFALILGGHVCPKCGSSDLRRRGLALTTVGAYPRFRCESCGSWSQSGKSEARAELRGI